MYYYFIVLLSFVCKIYIRQKCKNRSLLNFLCCIYLALFLTCLNRFDCDNNRPLYRVSFALFLFFIFHCVIVALPITWGTAFHTQYFIFKIPILIGITAICFIIPNTFDNSLYFTFFFFSGNEKKIYIIFT